MKNDKKKVGLFFLTLVSEQNGLIILDELTKVLDYIQGKSKQAKKYDLSKDKFCFVADCKFDPDNTLHKLHFKSAAHSYRAKLIDKNTLEERDNPKKKEEGEGYKTHLAIKYINGDAIVILEQGQKAMSMKQVVEYLNKFILEFNRTHKREKMDYYFQFYAIPRDDFREILDSMSRVVCANIYSNKQILGSHALNFSDRLIPVRENIVIQVKAERESNIKHFVLDAFAKLMGGDVAISKLRVEGKNATNNDIIIDTDFITKKEYVDVQINEDTGEVNTPYMYDQLTVFANTFNHVP